MSKAEEISHLSDVTRAAVDSFLMKLNGPEGYLKRLQSVADAGGYITEETTEAIRLDHDATMLRALADIMLHRRAALLSNQPAPFKVAAE